MFPPGGPPTRAAQSTAEIGDQSLRPRSPQLTLGSAKTRPWPLTVAPSRRSPPTSPGYQVKPFEYTTCPLGSDDVEIAISHCGVCGSDLHTISGGWGEAQWPVVPSRGIIGEITAVGAEVSELAVGDRVGAIVFACLDKATCKECANDCDPICSKAVLTYNGTYADGEKSFGGYADYVRVHSKFAFKIPESIPSDVAAPLHCAGVTVYTPLKEYVQPSMRVGIVGIGGLGHLGLLFAKALDASPVAFSHSTSKEQETRALGAEDFVVISNADHIARAAQSVDVLLVTADAKNQPYDTYMSCVKKGGKFVMVRAPEDKMAISPMMLIMTKVSVAGSAVGGVKDTKEKLELAAHKKVFAVIQKLPMAKANEAIALVNEGKPRFRVVLKN